MQRPVTAMLVAACVLCSTESQVSAGEVVSWPAPKGERQEGASYQIWVENQPVDCYAARTLDPPFADKGYDHGGGYWFANFNMSGRVIIRVKSTRPLTDTVIRPVATGIEPTLVDEHTLTITLSRPTKLSIEPDGINEPLLLFANPMEEFVPSQDDPNVLFFGPGVHKPERLLLGDNQTLYLAGGAVVKAEVLVRGNNVRILGRGILDGSDWEWRKGPVGNLIALRNSHDVEINGITLRGSSHWSIVPIHCQRVTVRNVKLCNSRVQNDDGINPCNSQDVLITDCFIRSDDDCIAMKGLNFEGEDNNVDNITVENSTLWCDRARIFLLGHESRAESMRNITIRNLDIIHFSMTPFLFEPGENMRLENVRVEDIRIHGVGQHSLIRLRPVVNQYMHTKVPGSIRDILFKNVAVTGLPGKYLIELAGADAEHDVRDIVFDNVQIRGVPIQPGAPYLSTADFVENVSFNGDAQ